MSRPLKEIADEALTALDSTDEKIQWLGALMSSISSTLDHGDADGAATLSSLGAHLSLEWSSQLQNRASMFRKDLVKGAVQ